MTVDTAVVKNVREQSVWGIYFNVPVNSRNISTREISIAGITATDEGLLKGEFSFRNYF